MENQHLSRAEQFLEDFVFFAFPERPSQVTNLLIYLFVWHLYNIQQHVIVQVNYLVSAFI